MRRGHHWENTLVEHAATVSEEHVLTELRFANGISAIYASAPDAVEREAVCSDQPLSSKEQEGAGYCSECVFSYVGCYGENCEVRLLSNPEREMVPASKYVEAKLSAPMRGGFKLKKYWAQAALLGAGRVVVGIGNEEVSEVKSFPLVEITPPEQGMAWGTLERMLEHIVGACCSGGARGEDAWDLYVYKGSGMGRQVWMRVVPTELPTEALSAVGFIGEDSTESGTD